MLTPFSSAVDELLYEHGSSSELMAPSANPPTPGKGEIRMAESHLTLFCIYIKNGECLGKYDYRIL